MHENINNTELVDIRTVKVNQHLPKSEKIADYIRQIKTPSHYKCGKFTIIEEFTENGPSIETCLQGMMS